MASKYAWLIVRDHLADGPTDEYSAEGVCGPRGASDAMLADLRKGKGRAFRMYDDDGELYVSGRIIDTTGENEFGPLDDYGTGGLGCTEIRYRVGNRWVAL